MLAYHGTVVGNIDVLRPFSSHHSNLTYPCVYLSTNKALSAIYIWNRPYKWMTFEIQENGIPVYNESFKHGLYEFYNGVKGYLYTCEADFDVDDNTAIPCAVISKHPVPIKEVDIVENAYERILEYEAQGQIKINHFETLSEHQIKKDRRMVIGEIKRLELPKKGRIHYQSLCKKNSLLTGKKRYPHAKYLNSPFTP